MIGLSGNIYSFVTGENGTMLFYNTYLRQFQQIPSFTSYNINDIFDILNGLITAVGNNENIFYQNSNGSIWSQQSSGTNADLYSVSLVPKFYPYPTILFVRIAVGSGGTILKSTSPNPINWTPWTIIPSNTTQNLNSVILDTNVSFIVGNAGTILRWDVDSSYYFKKLEGNNISSFLTVRGVFNNYLSQKDEGFGGGTLPLYNEVHLTAWSYSQISYSDMHFVRFDVINKGNLPWTNTYFTFLADTDIGVAGDDYMGCDTVRKLGFGYNADNEDANYGLNPPAAGILLLKGAYSKYINQGEIGFTSFTKFFRIEALPPCEERPYNVFGAYNYMNGYKIDSTAWLDPTQSPKKKTKFIYPGDPETNTGWTEYKGSVRNCFRDTTGQILTINPPGDRSFNLSSGSDYLTVMPGDTQKIVICQLIARGSSNLNSVTKLKQLADVATEFYNTNFIIGVNNISTEIPDNFSLSQNYPNPFNSMTNVIFQIPLCHSGESESFGIPIYRDRNPFVSLKVYDLLGREIKTLVNEALQPGEYSVRFDAGDLPSGVYFYRLKAGDFSETKKLILLK